MAISLSRLIIIGLFSLFYLVSTTEARGIAERIVAVVGDEIILQSELDAGVNFLKAFSPNLPDTLLRREALKRMIQGKLILLEAEKETIQVSRSEVEEELRRYWENLLSRFPSEEDFQKTLTQEGVTERELKSRYGEEIRKKLLAQKLLQKKGLLQVSVSPLEVRKFYEENRDSIARKPPKVSLAHIFRLVTPGKEVEEKGQKKILEIYDIILRGGDFEEVARSFSEDERTKSSGGYLGWVKRGMLGEEIEEKIFPLKEGEISQPFRSPLGYEIYRCEKKREDAILVRHILIKVTPSREDTLREMNLLRQIRKKALSGENFESLAQKYSQDFETAKNGGYLGEFYIQQLPPQFQKILEKLEEGEISEPFFWLSETEAGTVGGFHILKVLDKEEEKFLPFEEMEEQIRNYLLEKKINEKSEEYLKRVEERTYIKTD